MSKPSPHKFSRREFIGSLAAGVALGGAVLLRPRRASASQAAQPRTYIEPE